MENSCTYSEILNSKETRQAFKEQKGIHHRNEGLWN